MNDDSWTELARALPRRGRLIGLDLGSKTIGLALSDVERRFASPLLTIKRKKFSQDARELAEIMTKHAIEAAVIGLPLNMDGSAGPRVQATRAFVRNMAPFSAIAFHYWDERLSTAAVTRTLLEQDVSRAKRAERVDKMAAAYILQGALDRMRRIAPPEEPGAPADAFARDHDVFGLRRD